MQRRQLRIVGKITATKPTMMNKSLLRPFQFPGLVRIGRQESDGGYVIPEILIRGTSLLLSFGLSLDWTFDHDFKTRNPSVRIIGVDHTIGFTMLFRRMCVAIFKVPYYTFRSNKLKVADYRSRLSEVPLFLKLFGFPSKHIRKMVTGTRGAKWITLDELLSDISSSTKHNVFLKMDIEGSEYEVIPHIVKHHERLNGLAIEFHDLHSAPETFSRGIDQLSEHFVIVHIHGNNWGIYSEEIDFPECVELTLVHRSLFTEEPVLSVAAYPRADLDVPNKFDTPGYVLNFD